MSIAGNLAPELRSMLKNMGEIDKKAKGVEKTLGTFAAPIGKAVAEAMRLSAALNGVKTKANGIERDFARWVPAAGKSVGELRNVRTTVDGIKASIRSVSSSMGTWSGGIGRVNRQLRETVTVLTRASRAASTINVDGAGGGSGGGATGTRGGRTRRRGSTFGRGVEFGAGVVGAETTLHGAGRGVRTGLDYAASDNREDTRQKNAGITPAEMEILRARAFDLSTAYPSLAPLTIREQGRNLIPNVGDFGKSMELIPEYLKAQVAIQTIAGPGRAADETEDLARFNDNIGKSMDAPATKAILRGYVRARQVDDKSVKGKDYVTMAKRMGAAGKAATTDFWEFVAPALIMQQGGAASGTDSATAFQNTVMGRATKESILAQEAAGLRTGVVKRKKKDGSYKVIRDGTLKSEVLFGKNAYEWSKQEMLPGAIAQGLIPAGWAKGDFSQKLTDEQRVGVTKYASSMSSDRRGANLFTGFLADMEQYEAIFKRLSNARGMEDIASDQRNDAYVAASAMGEQLKSLFGVLTGPAMAAAGPLMHDFAAGMAAITNQLTKSPEITRLAQGATIAGGGVALGAAGAATAPLWSRALTALGLSSSTGVGGAVMNIGRLFRTGVVGGGIYLGARTALGEDGVAQADKTMETAKRITQGKGTAAEKKAVEDTSAALRQTLLGWIPKVFGGLDEQWSGSKSKAVIGPGAMGPAPGAADAIKQTSTAIEAAGSAAGGAAPNLSSTASGINEVKNAAAGAGGALSGLAGQIRALGSVSPGGAPAAGGGATTAPAAMPGKQGGYAPPPSSTMTVKLTSILKVDGRRMAQNTEDHIIRKYATPNGTTRPGDGSIKWGQASTGPLIG